MRMERYPYNYPIEEYFPERRLVKGFEGGEVSSSEKDGIYYLLQDEGTMVDFLLPSDVNDLLELVTIYEFDSEEERKQYIQMRGWNKDEQSRLKDNNMNAYNKIIFKQIEWAKNRGIRLTGSRGKRGLEVYTTNLKDNLLQTLDERTRRELEHGDGGELTGKDGQPAKMQALHSSSALGVNVFDYWRTMTDLSILTTACGLTAAESKITGEIHFEQKYPIDSRFQFAPNIDVMIVPHKEGKYRAFAIECKFTEAYSPRKHGGLDEKYFDKEDHWSNLTATRKLALKVSPKDVDFEYLHAAQLIKHVLGLNRKYGHSHYRLLYLWYDTLGEPGYKHRQEVEKFSEIVRSDGVIFHEITYQELIIRLAEHRTDHSKYITYLTERFL